MSLGQILENPFTFYIHFATSKWLCPAVLGYPKQKIFKGRITVNATLKFCLPNGRNIQNDLGLV